jgi:hypothetical protein
MPKPKNPGEAIYVAISKKLSEANQKNDELNTSRYFLLEPDEIGKDSAFLTERTLNLSHLNYGPKTIKNSREFLEIVKKKLNL